ncbi:hypothetical protein PM082_004022 [Marasmius tenuissimus]|nr:hypothetical protein PM082_004022 [Marasmius tenuissimus]
MTSDYAIRTDRIRLLYFIQRAPHLTYEEFDKYWEEVHGPLFVSIGIAKKNIHRYEQLTVDQESKTKLQTIWPNIPDYDGIIVFEADSIEKLGELVSDEEWTTKVVPNAVKFINLETAKYMFCHTAPIINTKPSSKDGGVRLVANVIRKQGMTFEEFDRYWVEEHATVVADYPGVRDALGLYEQLHIVKDGVPPEIPQDKFVTKLTTEWDGVAFIDGESFEALAQILSEESYFKVRSEDENKFVNMQATPGMPMRVRVLIGS